jgi:hypothetical protein
MDNEQMVMPFSAGTRRNKVAMPVTALPNNLTGGTISIPIPRNGLASSLLLYIGVTGTTSAVAPTWADALEQAYKLIRNIRIFNNSNLTPINLSAYGLQLLNSTQKRNFNTFIAPGTQLALPGASQTFQWVFQIEIPFGFNQGINLVDGLLMLQSNTGDYTLEITTEAMTNVLGSTVLTALSGQVFGFLKYFEIPDSSEYEPAPLNMLNVLSEEIIPGAQIPNNGTFEKEISPLQGEVIKLFAQFVQGASPSLYTPFQYLGNVNPTSGANPVGGQNGAFINLIRLALNTVVTPELSRAYLQAYEFSKDYGVSASAQPLPGGVVRFLDGALEMSNPGEYSYPTFSYQQINPSLYSSVKCQADVNLNGATGSYVRFLRQYLQQVAYQAQPGY